MIRIRNLSLALDQSPEQLMDLAAQTLRLGRRKIRNLTVHKRSVDARKKDDVRLVYTIDVQIDGDEADCLKRCKCKNAASVQDYVYQIPAVTAQPHQRPVVVGFGPGGMFAALVLATAGLRPIVLERGQDALTRKKAVTQFWESGELDSDSNVQFGEGGAGTFSDGKLNTGVKNERIRWMLEQFHAAGARDEILIDAKPHVGTDVLLTVVQNLRHRIEALGGEIRFGCRLSGLIRTDGKIAAVRYTREQDEHTLPCDRLILAIGHSARDTFEMLLDSGVPMEPKAFSMGVRIEHPQSQIDASQYGAFAGNPSLPVADYKLAAHLPDGGSAYTFCMCPGGYVVAAASESGGVVTNGMSNADRDGTNANSAVLVTLLPSDFPDPSTLGGIHWQRQIEQAAYDAGGGNYHAPAQLVGDFLNGQPSTAARSVAPTYLPGVRFTNLDTCLPDKITDTLRRALPALDRKLHGFAHPDAVMTAPETRSSCPVRILRDESMQSQLRGLFPCAEGAGYAGGITSSAVDGMRCAEALIASL